jgi:hypothetical protein
MKESETKYETLRKKHNLPKLTELKKEFGVKLEKSDLILHSIVDKMKDQFSDRARVLESIIFVRVSSSPSYLYEAKMLEENKEKLFEIFKELMSLSWEGEKTLFSKDSEKVSFIKKGYDIWVKKLKSGFIETCDLLEKKWKQAEIGKNQISLTYHG